MLRFLTGFSRLRIFNSPRLHHFLLRIGGFFGTGRLLGAHPVPKLGCRSAVEPGNSAAILPGQIVHPLSIVLEDHPLGGSADLGDPAGVFARGQRQRDEGITDVVLTSGSQPEGAERRQPEPFVQPFLR